LIGDTLAILTAVGIPVDSLTERRRVRIAKAILSLAGMKPGTAWNQCSCENRLRSRDIIRWMNKYLDEDYSLSSYDHIRKDLDMPVAAGIVMVSAGKKHSATNDGTRPFALSMETVELMRTYGTSEWTPILANFLVGRASLAEELKRERLQNLIPIKIGSKNLYFGPGEHNRLQKAIIEDFLPRFGHSSKVLYVGDTQDKLLFMEEKQLIDLGFFELSHDKLPDVLAYSKEKNWLFLVEAVHSANPISELRKRTLEQLTKTCSADIVYVSAFLTRVAFRKFARDIAWETEVWIAESPDHLVHFNGDKFLGPHTAAKK
jgi:type II restriction enzyme